MDADATTSLDCTIVTRETHATEPNSKLPQRGLQLPHISEERRIASLHEQPCDLRQVKKLTEDGQGHRTFLYLAYGSNLCAATFQGQRQIKPLAQSNVVVPQISLTFDLPGIPYTEPCFGNCKYREHNEKISGSARTEDYHKDRWRKGLVGVVYEVTAADYVHIIATEGGGSGYQDVLVDCFVLDNDPSAAVPMTPTTPSFKAHTLFSPPNAHSRPDHSYAQPSARYKKLITDGADEHDLPYEYRDFLANLRTYQMTTIKQRVGQAVFAATWGPIMSFLILVIGKLIVKKNGTYPKWFANLLSAMFGAIWGSYDRVFKPVFGDGERTTGDNEDQSHILRSDADVEKTPLLRKYCMKRSDGP